MWFFYSKYIFILICIKVLQFGVPMIFPSIQQKQEIFENLKSLQSRKSTTCFTSTHYINSRQSQTVAMQHFGIQSFQSKESTTICICDKSNKSCFIYIYYIYLPLFWQKIGNVAYISILIWLNRCYSAPSKLGPINKSITTFYKCQMFHTAHLTCSSIRFLRKILSLFFSLNAFQASVSCRHISSPIQVKHF